MQLRSGFFVAAGLVLTLVACGKSNADADSATVEVTEAPAVSEAATAAPAENPAPVISPMDENSLALAEMSLGDPDAPVKLVEYASLTCPACASFHQRMFPRVKEEYIDTGKIYFTFREFPLQNLDYLVFALSRCAAEERGATGYFAMVSTLFKNQNVWTDSGQRDTEILKYAAQAGMNEDQFKACVTRQEITDKVQQNRQAGIGAGVNSTPSFLINGAAMERYRSEEEYFALLDEAVAAAEAE